MVYLWWFLLAVFLIFTVALTWYLSFSVPNGVTNALVWLEANKRSQITILICFIIILISLSLLLYVSRSTVNFDPLLREPALFIFGAGILLLSSFFVTEGTSTSNSSRFVDTHPLILYVVVFLFVMAFISAMVASLKLVYPD